jgi:hypothetical protein
MTDFVEWLLACIAEDEVAAREAADVTMPEWHVRVEDAYEMQLVHDSRGKAVVFWEQGSLEDGLLLAAHIARHDPARVLAECAAKRRIVELHRHEAKGPGPVLHDGARDLNEGVFGCVICSCVDDDPGWHFTGGWCQTVRLLGLPYTGRDGYDERWRPDE